MTRTVLVTGGTGGIGRALVQRFARLGDQVWFTDPARVEVVDVDGAAVPPRGFLLDLTSHDSVQRLVEALPGPPDVLVHNAAVGSGTVRAVADEAHEQDRMMFQVNAIGLLWLNALLVPRMLERGSGKVVLFSSVGGGITLFPGFSYADEMSKAAVAVLGRMLAADLARTGVDVFTVCPGATRTSMFEASTLGSLSPVERERFLAALPKGRLVEPDEIAELVVFLCGESGRVLHGAVIDASLGLGVNPGLLPR
jgi:NAD(P)-dependent dehydrogenase (short-subunit alcohol dehydrogenase family)